MRLLPFNVTTTPVVPENSAAIRVKQRSGRLPLASQGLHFQGHGLSNSKDVLQLSSGSLSSKSSVQTDSDSWVSDAHWERLNRLQCHAKASVRLNPNHSGRHYAALVLLADGTEGLSANVEANRQLTLCDLRLALGAAQNQWIQKQVHQEKSVGSLPPVSAIYLVSANLEKDHPTPCADCQEWLASPLCSPDVSVISLENGPDGKPLTRKRSVGDMLPLYKERNGISKTEQPIEQLPVAFSALSQHAGDAFTLSEAPVKAMMLKAQKAYHANERLAQDSRAATGVAVLLQPSGIIADGGRVDWSTRLNEPADLSTVAAGLALANRMTEEAPVSGWRKWLPWPKSFKPSMLNQADSVKSPVEQTVQAMAYYGDDPQLPPITSLGRIARKRGSANTLIMTIEQDQIQVRTIKDFLPELYRAR